MYPHVTHTDRYVQRSDPDRAVKPPPIIMPIVMRVVYVVIVYIN